MSLGAACHPPQGPWKPADNLSHLLLESTPIIKPCHQYVPKGAFICIWHLSFYCCHLKNGPLDHLALIAKGVCIPESHKTVANKKTVLNGCRTTTTTTHVCTPVPSGKGAGKNVHLLVTPWKGPNYILLHLLPEGLACNQPASKGWMQFSPLRQ